MFEETKLLAEPSIFTLHVILDHVVCWLNLETCSFNRKEKTWIRLGLTCLTRTIQLIVYLSTLEGTDKLTSYILIG